MTRLAAIGALLLLATGCPSKPADMTEGKPFPPVSVMFNTNESHKQIAEAIVQMWKEQLGINVALGNTEWKVYLAEQTAKNYDICRAGWINDFNDPHNDIEMFITDGGNNRTGWSSKEYDDLVAASMREPDTKKRFEIYRKAEALLINDAPILPVYYYTNKNLVSKRVRGWHDTVLNLHPYDAIWIADKAGNPEPPEKQVLVYNNGVEPATLDPGKMSGVGEHHCAVVLYEGLCRSDPKTLEPLPGVAERWDISSDGLTYTFHLRANARWQDSKGNDKGPVTAQDFVYSWLRVVKTPEGEEPSEYQYIFDWIKGAKDIREGKEKDLSKFGVRAIDERTLEVKLESACGFFLELAAYQTYMPVHRATVEKHKLAWTQPENIVANGPFLLDSWTPKKEIVFKRSKIYWRANENRLETLRFLPIDDQNTALSKFLNGEMDWGDDSSIPLARADQVLKNPNFRCSPYLGIYFYRFNCERPPFNDARVRRAFSMAVDKRAICSNVQRFGEGPAGGLVPAGCGVPVYESPPGLPYDPERARALLREAGYSVKQPKRQER
jgi:oligopeptide transport system substrate-binding protein